MKKNYDFFLLCETAKSWILVNRLMITDEERHPCSGEDIEGSDRMVAQGLEGAPLATGVDECVVVHGCKVKKSFEVPLLVMNPN